MLGESNCAVRPRNLVMMVMVSGARERLSGQRRCEWSTPSRESKTDPSGASKRLPSGPLPHSATKRAYRRAPACSPKAASQHGISQNTHRSGVICMRDAGRTENTVLSRQHGNTHTHAALLHACTPALTSALVHAKLPRITQRHEDFQRSRSEATNHWPPFPLALGAVRSDWDHRKSEANGFLENPRTLVRLTELAGAD
jgi:hypothetical protein